MRNVYDHLVKEFSNPTRLQATGETYAEVKDEIVKFEASLCDGELDRNKDIAGYDPNSKRDHDYDFQVVAKARGNRRNEHHSDAIKAFMTSRHSTPNRKRTSTESSIGSSSKRSRYSGRRSGEGRISVTKEDDLTREFRQYVNTNNTSSSNVQPCANCGKKHVGYCKESLRSSVQRKQEQAAKSPWQSLCDSCK
jgi:hypothetical protein